MRKTPHFTVMGMLAVACLLGQGCASLFGSGTGDELLADDEELIDEPAIKDIPPVDLGVYTARSKTRRADLTARNETGLPKGSLTDVLFDFDQATLRKDALPVLEANAKQLQEEGVTRLLLEGRGDEVGTAAYNLVLGERRAKNVKAYLQDLGIPLTLKTTSYGKDRPLCFQQNGECHQKNRSVHFVVKE